MKDNLTQITILLDRSGSMSEVREATISGFNEFVDGQRKAPGEANLTLIQFDTENAYEVVFDAPITAVLPLTAATFIPRGGTPLHDAIGTAIDRLGKKFDLMKAEDRPGKVVIVVMTDGKENSSHFYPPAKIAEMIKLQREVYKWEFLFLGANQDAILTGERLNIPAANSITYAHTATGTGNVMSSTSANLRGYRGIGGQSTDLGYTPEQRKEAAEETEEAKQKPV